MSLTHCPHCGAENFTVEGWEDLDRCSSCGKSLREPGREVLTSAAGMGHQASEAGRRSTDRDDENAENPRPA